MAATATVIFTLATVFTSTIAWFSTKTSTTVSGGSFTVKPVSGLQYDLYYLDHFVIDQSTNKDGNFNTIVDLHSGYEVAGANPVFNLVTFDDNGHVIDNNQNVVSDDLNPTNISHLWPAHKLTYAIVIESGDFNSFILDSWDEETDANSKTKDNNNNDVLVSLSWAINLYGAAYHVTKTNNEAADVATGFATYAAATLSDTFNYSQASPAPAPHTAITMATGFGDNIVASDSTRQILYFSVEFDDSTNTYYTLGTDSYYTKDTLGNSNCYEHLILKDLVFKIA